MERDNVKNKQVWQDIICYPLGNRNMKPREKGFTMVIDKGLSPRETEDLLQTSGNYIDYLKLGFGTAAFYSEQVLEEKINLANKYSVDIYPGGTFLEVAIIQGKYEHFLYKLHELGIKTIEISDGTIYLESKQRIALIKKAVQMGFNVLTEVGKKDPTDIITTKELLMIAEEDLASGASIVIMEGRESGKNIGLYDKDGKIIEDLLLDFIENNNYLDKIMWEAPLKNQQLDFITRFGPNVSLGNIHPSEILALEALRTGLRGDTLKLVLKITGKIQNYHEENQAYHKLFNYIPPEFLAAASK